MRKYLWIAVIALIACAVYFTSCERIPKEMMDTIMPDAEPAEETMEPEPVEEMVETMEPEPTEMMEMPVGPADVLIYTGAVFWIGKENASIETEITQNLLQSAGFQAEITESDASVRDWMLQTTADGAVNVLIVYGVMPNAIYPQGNGQPDGSVAENWIETSDGDTILNHADYFGYNSNGDMPLGDEQNVTWRANDRFALRNLMDNPNIDLFVRGISADGGISASMVVTSDGTALTPSLVNFDSYRPIPLNQLQGEWFAEKVFASDTGDDQAAYADPVIVRDGNRGRLALVHATADSGGLSNGEVAAEIITNYLLAE